MRYPLERLEPTIFRAYDIRGIVGPELTDATVYHLGRAFAAEARARGFHEVLIGADGRLSGPHLKALLAEGLTDGGCDAVDIGFVATPLLYFAAWQSPDCTGIIITGSHNPPDYNGFKIMLGGLTLSGDDIQALRKRIEARDYSEGRGEGHGEGHGQRRTLDIRPDYRRRVRDDIRLARRLKVVVDCGNGIAGDVAPDLFEALGCEVIPLYCEVDGHFPHHHPDPSKPENLTDLITAVRSQHADLGLAFDGDGDRIGVITPAGKLIWPDRLMMLFAEDVLTRNPGAEIICDVKCSSLLLELIRHAGGKATLWKSGHSLIKRRMRETGALLAGEMSGHIYFRERWYGFDDGLYSAARLLELLSHHDGDADSLFAGFPEYLSTPELHIDVDEARKFDIVGQMQQETFPDSDVSHIDGVRVDYPDGWGLIRASNTTPLLVLRFEACDQATMARIRDDFARRLQRIDPSLRIPEPPIQTS